MLVPGPPRFIFFDVCCDKKDICPGPLDAQNALVSAAVVALTGCASGSSRGSDELLRRSPVNLSERNVYAIFAGLHGWDVESLTDESSEDRNSSDLEDGLLIHGLALEESSLSSDCQEADTVTQFSGYSGGAVFVPPSSSIATATAGQLKKCRGSPSPQCPLPEEGSTCTTEDVSSVEMDCPDSPCVYRLGVFDPFISSALLRMFVIPCFVL